MLPGMPRHQRTTAVAIALGLGIPALWPLGRHPVQAQEGRPPDLRLEWLAGGAPVTGATAAVRARAGETVTVPYRLRNVGGSDAFTAILEARTALGRTGPPERLQPGPAAGSASDRSLTLAVADGMRELCLDARLQTLEPQDPGDPNPRDNRICRPVEVVKDTDSPREER
jgi:hypothetical protein